MPFSGAGAMPVAAKSSSTRDARPAADQRLPPFSIAAGAPARVLRSTAQTSG